MLEILSATRLPFASCALVEPAVSPTELSSVVRSFAADTLEAVQLLLQAGTECLRERAGGERARR